MKKKATKSTKMRARNAPMAERQTAPVCTVPTYA